MSKNEDLLLACTFIMIVGLLAPYPGTSFAALIGIYALLEFKE